MTDPRRSKPSKVGSSRPTFRHRFDELERRRLELVAQLESLRAVANHPGYRNAQLLLSTTFRKATLVKRAAVLEAAAWLIDVLEKLPIAGL